MELLKHIKGIDELINALPEKYRYWSIYDKLIQLQYEQIFDEEKEFDYIYNMKMVVESYDSRYRIRLLLKNVSGEFTVSIGSNELCFEIESTEKYGYQKAVRLHLYDFENHDLSLYCESIEVELLD